jgi:hypothetical protein
LLVIRKPANKKLQEATFGIIIHKYYFEPMSNSSAANVAPTVRKRRAADDEVQQDILSLEGMKMNFQNERAITIRLCGCCLARVFLVAKKLKHITCIA